MQTRYESFNTYLDSSFVYEVDNRVVGYCRWIPEGNRCAYISILNIDESHRDQGIGSALMQVTFKDASAQCDKVTVIDSSRHHQTSKIAIKLGFINTGSGLLRWTR